MGVGLLLAAIALFGVVWALSSITVNNTASITAGNANLFLLTGVSSTTICTASTGTYSDTGLSISWGPVAQGSSNSQYACLENTGSNHVLSTSNTLPASDGTLAITSGGSALSGQTINNGQFMLVTTTWSVAVNAPVSASVSFAITVA